MGPRPGFALGLAGALFALSGCVLPELSFEDRPCPCATGYVCVDEVCVVEGSVVQTDAGPGDTGAADAGPPRDGGDPGDANALDTGADAGEPEDVGPSDGAPDAAPDAGPDAGPEDTGPEDTGPGDTGPEDTGPGDTGPVDSGPVQTPCVTDEHCGGADPVCEGGFCAPACTMGGCATGLTCDLATGHCFNASSTCAVDADCGSGSPVGVCVGGQCQYGCGVSSAAGCEGDRICDTDGFCRVAPGCVQASDCGRPDFVCQNNVCVRRCDAPRANLCLGNSTCNASSGRCAGAMAVGQDCTTNATCTSGNCLTITAPSMQSFCTRGCGATADCPLGTSCLPVDGAKVCVRESVFSPRPSMDTASGVACTNPGNTCQSLLCPAANVCMERCTQDSHCEAFGTQCITVVISGGGGTTYVQQCDTAVGAGAPGDVCPNDDNSLCQSGVCNRYRNRCAGGCCSDADCPAAESCLVYDLAGDSPHTVCQPRTGAGALGLGSPCGSPANCDSDNCAPRDPGNLGGPKSCTTHCCTDADCAGYPGGARCAAMPAVGVAARVNYCVPLVP